MFILERFLLYYPLPPDLTQLLSFDINALPKHQDIQGFSKNFVWGESFCSVRNDTALEMKVLLKTFFFDREHVQVISLYFIDSLRFWVM